MIVQKHDLIFCNAVIIVISHTYVYRIFVNKQEIESSRIN